MKEAYYFSHDSNARHDPKISAMRGVYGAEGYGWYWILVEMMRDSDGYRLDMQAKYSWNAYASQMHTDRTTAESFIGDCIYEFGLFDTDGAYFWSNSLLRRMIKRERVNAQRKKAADARWGKGKGESDPIFINAENMHMHSECNADEMQNDAKESKGKESKGNIKEEHMCDPADQHDMSPPLPTPPPPEEKYAPEFESFWKVYPAVRKRDKAKAFKVWQKKVKKFDPQLLISCTVKYSKDTKAIGLHGEFAKMPVTFLNAETYRDYERGEPGGNRQTEPFGGGQADPNQHHEDGAAQAAASREQVSDWSNASEAGGNGQGRGHHEARTDDDIFVRR